MRLIAFILLLLCLGMRLGWDWNPAPGGTTNVVFEVWASTNLAQWQLFAVTAEKEVSFEPTNQCQFFAVRVQNVDTGEYSIWNVK